MGYNAIEIDGEVKLDLSEDTVTEETLPEGVTAHDANGEPIQGKMKFVKSINGKTGDVTLNASDVGAEDAGTVSTHNTNTEAHNDIRLELTRLSGIINDVLDSDDVDLNELHEIVAYIKSNNALIAAITVSKVNVADIINNLTTNVTDKPLSSAQGVVLNGLIDALNKDKLDASKLAEAINTALAEAKASGDFNGENGVGIDKVTINNNGELEITYTDGNGANVGKVKGEDGVLTPDQESLLETLKGWYDEEHYVKMTGTLSMSPSTTTYEVNDSKSVTFSWSFSKTPIEVIFNGQTQANATSGSKTLTVTSSTPATKTYSLYGKYKEGETVTRELTINFRNYRYWGMAEYTDTIDTVLLAKLNKEFATSRTKNFNLGDSSSDKHIWYIFPTRFGTASFTANGLKGGFDYLGEKELPNSKGFKEYFHVYRSIEAGVGTANIVVS